MLKDVATKGLTDGKAVTFSKVFVVVGTTTYTTAIGGSNTIFLAVPLDVEAVKIKLAELKGVKPVEKPKEGAKLKAEDVSKADARVLWFNESYKTTIRKLDTGEWQEVSNVSGEVVRRLKETLNTADFIELVPLDREQVWRLRKDRMQLKKGESWEWLANGKWVTN